jgi:hypothetical protein
MMHVDGFVIGSFWNGWRMRLRCVYSLLGTLGFEHEAEYITLKYSTGPRPEGTAYYTLTDWKEVLR